MHATNRHSTAESLNFELHIIDANGTNDRRLTDHPKTDTEPAWSPTSDRIAFTSTRDSNAEIYVVNVDGTGLQNLTKAPGGDAQPAWSADGKRIAFVSDRGGPGTRNVFVMNADGSGVRQLTSTAGAEDNAAWLADGATIAFSKDLNGNTEVEVVNTTGSTVVRRVTNRPGFDGHPTWSPDGRIAFASTTPAVPGSSDIRVIRPDGAGDVALTTHVDWEGAPSWAARAAGCLAIAPLHGRAAASAARPSADGTGPTRAVGHGEDSARKSAADARGLEAKSCEASMVSAASACAQNSPKAPIPARLRERPRALLLVGWCHVP